MVEKIGDVKEVFDNFCKVQIKRDSACGESCSSCGGCKKSQEMIVAKNQVNAKVGDRVKIIMCEKKLFFICFVVYIVPILFMVLGYYIAERILGKEDVAIFVSFLSLFISFFVSRIFDKLAKNRFMPTADFVIYKK